MVRDAWSYEVAKRFSTSSELYNDFCYDLLDGLWKIDSKNKWPEDYILLNVNKYLWNEEVIDKCRQFVKKNKTTKIYFLPAAWGSDDKLFSEIASLFPSAVLRDRRNYSVEEICSFISWAKAVLAARLHVLLVTQYYNVPFDALVYQEKIEKVILSK